MVLVNMCISSVVSGTAVATAGLYNPVFQASDVTSATDWSSYKALYQEFRVVGLMLKFVPKYENAFGGNQTLAGASPSVGGPGIPNEVTPLFMCKTHSSAVSGALTTLDQASNHFDSKMIAVNRPLSCSIKMVETDEAQWQSTNSGTTGTFGIKTFLNWQTLGATDVVNWGTMFEYFAVQFRGRVVSTLASSAPSLLAAEKKGVSDWKTPMTKWADTEEEFVCVPRSAVKDSLQPAMSGGAVKIQQKISPFAGAVAAAGK